MVATSCRQKGIQAAGLSTDEADREWRGGQGCGVAALSPGLVGPHSDPSEPNGPVKLFGRVAWSALQRARACRCAVRISPVDNAPVVHRGESPLAQDYSAADSTPATANDRFVPIYR
jgi:hypothetical protein